MTRRLVIALAVLSAGCGYRVVRDPSRAPAPVVAITAYQQAIYAAQRASGAGDYAAADSILRAFAATAADAHEARETSFWRALYQTDPRNRLSSTDQGISSLDAYLRSDSVYWYRSEAAVVRRIAALHRTADSTARGDPRADGDGANRSREEEIAALRDQLAKANAELERIKRRLASPRP